MPSPSAQLPLSFVGKGNKASVVRCRGNNELHHHLENLGFVEGAEVLVVSDHGGNLIVEVQGSQIAIDKDVALKIMMSC